jgi:hypothetical protein
MQANLTPWTDSRSLTPLQRALRSFREALEHAQHDERSRQAFLDIVAVRLAREYVRQLDRKAA